jgi:arylsulfatase A-like enzyme
MNARRPNILYIMSDDHAAHAISACGSRINDTPQIDRIAAGGMRFNNCFCTNSICTPSRASVLTGTYNHVNRVTTLASVMDNRLTTFPKLLHRHGYQTALFGKWHLGHGPAHDPTGFDAWGVLPGQGLYHNPELITPAGPTRHSGYVTDLITDQCLDWLRERDAARPFCLLCHHKAPHRRWEPDAAHAHMYDAVNIPEPDTLFDDYRDRSQAAREAEMRISRDLDPEDFKQPVPAGLSPEDETRWKYQRYIKDYLACVASVDDNVGRLLDYLDAEGLAENTIVVYTSDQGFFLGDHGWYDKRFMYEESLRMPFLIRYPREIRPESVCEDMILNVDFASTFLDCAGVDIPETLQGASFRPMLRGARIEGWRTSMYYRYWMHLGGHGVRAHYGIRTRDHKLIYYYADALGQPGALDERKPPEWELFDLKRDPREMRSVHGTCAYAGVTAALKSELDALQRRVGDEPYPAP